ncbi:MAG: glycoside hydrolase family 3 C-terminal domain-containing protein [Chthoniobacteraceae bacterium]
MRLPLRRGPGGYLTHGMDLEMPSAASLSEPTVKTALADGQVTLEAIDAAVQHILLAEFSMGFFDRPQKIKSLPEDSPESSRAALEIARSAVVLLKNENETLPLDAAKIRSIAVYGDYAMKTPISGGGSGHVAPFHTVNYLDGIRAAAGDKVSVSFEPAPKADPSVFETLACAQVSVDGPAGLSLKATVSPAKEPEEAAQTGGTPPMEAVVPGINLAWGDQNRPFGIPVGRNGVLTWDGVLVAPEDGDWELIRDYEGTARWNPKPNIRIGTPPPQFSGNLVPQWENGDGLHLTKGQAVPISVHWYVFPRGRQTIKVGLRRIAPDVERARKADAVIVCTGRMAGESNDSFFDLPLAQQRLVEALAAVNPRTIVVNTSGAGLGLAGVSEAAPALLQAWFLGQEAGTALGEILFGKVNPSGRLPMTFDRDLADNAAFANYPGELPGPSQPPVVEYKEGVFVGYRGYDRSGKAPLYPFGHGLGYTHFAYGELSVERVDESARVTLNITNDGPREGAEVVQIYVGPPASAVERPPRELKGFAKVSLQPGETQKVAIDLPRDAFAYWSPEKKAWTVDPGEFVIEAGASSRDLRLKQTVRIGE